MSEARRYPDELAGPFPRAPRTIEDGAGRVVELEAITAGDALVSSLVDMYEDFDPADRAQGLPPVRREAIVDWIEMIIDDGPDVLAIHDGEPIGHATLVPDGEEGYELAIFVHQDFRGAGIGTALLETLLGTAAESGIERVWLTVERWNTVAVRLYEAVGFQRTESGSFELEMTLRLDPQTASTG